MPKIIRRVELIIETGDGENVIRINGEDAVPFFTKYLFNSPAWASVENALSPKVFINGKEVLLDGNQDQQS